MSEDRTMTEASLTVKYLKGIPFVWWLMQSPEQSKHCKVTVLLEADVANGKMCCEFLNIGSDSRFDRADFVLIEDLGKTHCKYRYWLSVGSNWRREWVWLLRLVKDPHKPDIKYCLPSSSTPFWNYKATSSVVHVRFASRKCLIHGWFT